MSLRRAAVRASRTAIISLGTQRPGRNFHRG
jgi:hypothetical protein